MLWADDGGRGVGDEAVMEVLEFLHDAYGLIQLAGDG